MSNDANPYAVMKKNVGDYLASRTLARVKAEGIAREDTGTIEAFLREEVERFNRLSARFRVSLDACEVTPTGFRIGFQLTMVQPVLS